MRRLRLYHYSHSSMSWAVRMGLGFKRLAYDSELVDIRRESDQHRARRDYYAINPFGQVPVLEWEDGGELRRVSQSIAILELLEEFAPEPALLPDDPFERARCRELAAMIQSGTQPLQNNYVLGQVSALGAEERAWGQHFIARGLAALERAAAPSTKRFLTGDELRLPDLYLGPQLFNARRFDVPLQEFPALLRVEQTLAALEIYRATHPETRVTT